MVKPKVLAPIAGEFYLDNHEVACIMGPVGSGKSTASALRLGRHAMWQQPAADGVAYSRFVIVRNTGPQLQDTTMKTWFDVFPNDGSFRKWTSTSKTQVWFGKPKGFKNVVRAEFLFRALDGPDDIAKLLSLDVTGFWFNEIREIDPEIFAAANARVGRYPGADRGGCTWKGRIGDTNPWSSASEFHRMFVANKRDGYFFLKQPGGMEPDAENLENLEQTNESLALPYGDPKRREQGRNYYKRLMRDYAPHDSDMYVHCKYGASRTGKPVFVSYDDNAHCKEFELARSPDSGRVPLWIGYDDTGRNPAAVVAQRTDTGQWRVRYEFAEMGMGVRQHAAELRRFLAQKVPGHTIERITCDPAGAAKGADDLDMRMLISREFSGVPVLNARTNDIATRIEAVDGTLRRLINGEPALLIHPDCEILREACTSKYQYRKLKISGGERYTEIPDKITPFADACDALGYLLLGGGEGRLGSGSLRKEIAWPEDGAAINPTKPVDSNAHMSDTRSFDPRGNIFSGY